MGVRFPAFNHDGGTHLGACLKGPAHAAACFVERVNGAILAADKHRTHGDGRLRTGALSIRKAEGPFQLELAEILGLKSGYLFIDEALVLPADTPARLGGRAIEIEARSLTGAHGRGWLLCKIRQRLFGEIFGDRLLMGFGEGGRLRLHDAVFH